MKVLGAQGAGIEVDSREVPEKIPPATALIVCHRFQSKKEEQIIHCVCLGFVSISSGIGLMAPF